MTILEAGCDLDADYRGLVEGTGYAELFYSRWQR